jgi:hypothetical protein
MQPVLRYCIPRQKNVEVELPRKPRLEDHVAQNHKPGELF